MITEELHYNGPGEVTVFVNDNANEDNSEDSQLVTITILPVNDSPEADDMEIALSEDSSITLSLIHI